MANETRRVLITGSREWSEMAVIRAALMTLEPGSIIAHGAARGADSLADEAAKTLPVFILRYPVDTIVDGPWPKAGTNRNTRMLFDFKPTLCLAFPTKGSRGTWDMVRKCRDAGVPVIVYGDDGEVLANP